MLVLVLFLRRGGDSRFGGNLGKSEKSSFLVQKQGAQAKICVDTNHPTYVGILIFETNIDYLSRCPYEIMATLVSSTSGKLWSYQRQPGYAF